MKHLFTYLFIYLLMPSCNAQTKEYSTINFDISYFKRGSKNFSKQNRYYNVQENYYQEKGFLRIYFFPKNPKMFFSFINNPKYTYEQLQDSVSKLRLSINKSLQFFEVYAFWVEKKYLEVMKEGGEDGKMYDVWYIPSDKPIKYNVFQLTKEGWLYLKKDVAVEKFTIDIGDVIFPFLSADVCPNTWKDCREKFNQ